MKDILDFKNDVLFKYTLSNDQDPGCLYLLRMILKDVAGIESKSIKVTNPDLNPEHIEDKDMILDIRVEDEQGQIINVGKILLFQRCSIKDFKFMEQLCFLDKRKKVMII